MTILEEWWSDESPDYPTCRVCKKQIGEEEPEDADETYEPEVAFRVFRVHPTKMKGELQELAFHFACIPEELKP